MNARRMYRKMVVVLVATTAMATGCASQVTWQGYAFDPVFRQAKSKNALTLVYIRNWYSVKCTEFEEKVWSDPDVISATNGLYCVKVDRDMAIDRPLANLWGIQETPGVAIIAPTGTLLRSMDGNISKDRLLEMIAWAKSTHAATSSPMEMSPTE